MIISLDPRSIPDGIVRLQARPTLGLEVTIPELAGACSLGNVDPQHLGGDASTAAIEAALTWPLPPAGSALAVLRPDADALGAAAVLRLRRDGVKLTGEALTRIAQIADADKEARGPWPGPRPIDDAASLLRPTSALEAACMNHRTPLESRADAVREWILTGHLEGGKEQILRLYAEALEALARLDTRVSQEVAVVTGAHRLAMSIGYRLSPVVVATNPSFSWQGGPPHVKHTVARWNSAHPMRWDRMLTELRIREPGWGGSTSICGSPQGKASTLTQDQVLEVVTRHLQH